MQSNRWVNFLQRVYAQAREVDAHRVTSLQQHVLSLRTEHRRLFEAYQQELAVHNLERRHRPKCTKCKDLRITLREEEKQSLFLQEEVERLNKRLERLYGLDELKQGAEQELGRLRDKVNHPNTALIHDLTPLTVRGSGADHRRT